MARYIQFICTITESLHVSLTVAYLWLTSVHHIKFIKYSKTLIQMDRNLLQLKNINLKSRPKYLFECVPTVQGSIYKYRGKSTKPYRFLLVLSNLSSAETQVLYSSPQNKASSENNNEWEIIHLASKHFYPWSHFSTIRDLLHHDITDCHLHLLSR